MAKKAEKDPKDLKNLGGEGDDKPKEGEEGYQAPQGAPVKPKKPEGGADLEDDDEDSEDDESEEDEEESDDDDEEDNDVIPRGAKAMPLKKFKKYETRWNKEKSELQSQIEQLKKGGGKPSEEKAENISELAKQLSDDYGGDSKLIEKILNHAETIASKKSQLAPELVKRLEAFEEDLASKKHEAIFEREFAGLVKAIPGAAEAKDRLKELAFTDGKIEIDGVKYPVRSVPLRVLYEIGVKSKVPKKKSGEGSRGGNVPTETDPDFSGVTNEDIRKMNATTFGKYREWLKDNKVQFTY